MKTVFSSIKTTYRKFRSELKRYCLLLLVPLVLGLILLLFVQSVTLPQLDRSGNDSVLRFRAEAYGIVRELQIISNSIVSDGTLQAIASAPEPASDPLGVSQLIRKHLDDSSFVSDVYMFSEKQNCIYSQNAFYDYAAANTMLNNITGENLESLTDPGNLGWHILNAHYTAPYYIAEFPEGDTILLVTLNKTEFIRTFFNNGTLVCSMFNQNFSISNQLINTPDTDWYNEQDVSIIAGERVKCFYLEQDGYTYMTALSRSEYNAPVKIILAVFGIYFVLILIFGVCYLLRVSQKRYNDVISMIGDLPHTVSSDSSYEYLVAAMRQSLEDYKQHYHNQIRFQRRNQLIPLIAGTRSTFSEDIYAKIGLKKAKYGYYVALIHFSDCIGVAINSPPPANIDITCTVLSSALSQAAKEYMDIAITHMDRNYVAVISVLSPQITKEDIRYILDETVYAVENEYGSNIFALASGLVQQPEEIAVAYKTATELYGFAHSAGSDVSVLLQSDMEEDAGNMLNGNFTKQLQLISATMQLEKYNLVPQLVDAILNEHVANLGTYYSLTHSRISAVANILVEAVAASALPHKEVAFLVSALQLTHSIARLNELATELCESMQKLSAEKTGGDIVSKACDFIDHSISNASLSVPDISDAMGISVQHLSRLFRRKLNITVVEYINKARIDHAKELIAEGGMTVNKIAEAAGYSNNVTFSRNFRRYVGMSPSEYREISRS